MIKKEKKIDYKEESEKFRKIIDDKFENDLKLLEEDEKFQKKVGDISFKDSLMQFNI